MPPPGWVNIPVRTHIIATIDEYRQQLGKRTGKDVSRAAIVEAAVFEYVSRLRAPQ